MHKTISKGSDDRNEEVIDNYHFWLADSIKNFVSNSPLLSPSSEETI